MTYRQIFDILLRMNNRQLNQQAIFYDCQNSEVHFPILEVQVGFEDPNLVLIMGDSGWKDPDR